MKYQVYYVVTKKYGGCAAARNSQHILSRSVSLLRAISCIVPHKTSSSLCGRLTSLLKVSLPQCEMLPRYPTLLLCCLKPAHPPPVFCLKEEILQTAQADNWPEWVPPTLRIKRKAAVYARRSNPTAKKKETDKSQSREMQTEDLLAWATGKTGLDPHWNDDDLEPYFADLGLSGTLRPYERPDMLRLFEDIDKGMYDHGSVICFQESRLFRDETQIYYNMFIEKCKQHDIVVVVVSPYLMIYDFQDEFLTEMFRWKCKEAGEFIRRQVKGWMLPARERAARSGMWAGLGDIAIGFVVDIDLKSPTYKRYVLYEPHAAIVRYLFKRFAELSGNLTLLIRELVERPIIFKPLSEDEKQKYYLRNGIMTRSGGVHYPHRMRN